MYIETTAHLARASGVGEQRVRDYAKEGLLDYVTASNGTRLFREGQAARVREIYTQRMANRGRKRA